MKDLESKLRELRLRPPSEDLDRRVRAQKSEPPLRPAAATLRIPAWLAAAAALAMALAGFAAGRTWQEKPAARPRPSPAPMMIQVIFDSPASSNPFDYTHASEVFPAGKLEAKIQVEKGA